MIGTSWRRPQGLGDPLMSRVMTALGMKSVPLYENAPPERIRYSKIWQDAGEFRDGPVNPDRVEIDDVEEMTQTIKEKALALGATLVGVTELQPSFIDLDVDLPHKYVFAIVVEEKFEEVMKGPKAVEIEAHRSYAAVAEIATEVARHIRELGYPALAHHNGGTNVMAIPILYHAGFGELGKHPIGADLARRRDHGGGRFVAARLNPENDHGARKSSLGSVAASRGRELYTGVGQDTTTAGWVLFIWWEPSTTGEEDLGLVRCNQASAL